MAKENGIMRSCGTHNGSFHADEVTACALLLLFDQIDRSLIKRTRDKAILEQCDYVCDVGGEYFPEKRRFDHHQVEYTGLMSSAGMVWSYLRDEKIVDEELYQFFNHSLILGVDAHDNGRSLSEEGVCSFSQVISNFVPPVYDAPSEVMDRAFFEALDFVFEHLKRLEHRFRYIQSCKAKVEQSMAVQSRVLFFDEAIPWMDAFFALGGEQHPALFVVMPSGGHWKLRGIPPSLKEKMDVRVPLPQAWAGLLDKALKEVTGIPGAIFCHKGRFISVWETEEDARRALNYVLQQVSQ